jgi:acetyl esterase/lipase
MAHHIAPVDRNGGSRVALVLAVVAAAGALVIVAPSLHRVQWMARLALRETSLILLPISAAGVLVARGRRGRTAVLSRTLCGFAAVVALFAFVAPLTAFPRLREFSPAEYVLAGVVTPGVRVQSDVVLDRQRPRLTADVFHAPGPPPHPFVVVVHGGSWRHGEKGELPHASRRLAAAGYTVVDVRYALAPAEPFPRGIADVKCLLGRVRERAAELGIDPARAALLGRSAGGQIALVAAYSAGDPRIPPSCLVADEPVRAVAALYAPSDLVWGHDNPMVPDVIRGTESLQLYLGGPPAQAAEAYRLGTPMTWVDRAVPPTLLIHGGGDQLVSPIHSRRLAAALGGRGREVTFIEVPMGEHGMDARPGGVGEQIARHAVLDFLGARLDHPGPQENPGAR